ncbi:hypothetical protein [Cellulomonas sp. URHE0023]|uniref:hypothetical protein n=1 Tax=Cellulomonas sp. URHE0023 TaxID=1380354 RepID=UPI0004815934|nr:hypothetical protein [Cellulomonas sp. URHE0023]
MSASDADPAQVPNLFRAAVVSARSSSVESASALSTAIDKAIKAMANGAWVGGRAGDLEDQLTSWRTTCQNAANGAIDEFDHALRGQPDMVEANSWQAHWRPWLR